MDFSCSISAVPSLGLVFLVHDIQKHLWICGRLRPSTWWWAVSALIIPSVMRAVVILLMEVRHSIMGINGARWVLRSLSSGILDERSPTGPWVVAHRPLVVFCCHTGTASSPAFWRGSFLWFGSLRNSYYETVLRAFNHAAYFAGVCCSLFYKAWLVFNLFISSHPNLHLFRLKKQQQQPTNHQLNPLRPLGQQGWGKKTYFNITKSHVISLFLWLRLL